MIENASHMRRTVWVFTLAAAFSVMGVGVMRADDSHEPLKTVDRVAVRPERSSGTDWILHDTDRDWKAVKLTQLDPRPRRTFWLKLILPEVRSKHPELFIIAPVSDLEVYRADRPGQSVRMVYRARDGQYEKRYARTNLRIHFVPLGRVAPGQAVYVRVPAGRYFYVQSWRPIQVGDRTAFIQSVIGHDLNDAIVAFILMFIGICLLSFLAVERRMYQPFAGIGLYALLNGGNFFFLLPMTQLIVDQPVLRYYGEALTYHLILLGALLFMGTFSEPGIEFRRIKPAFRILMAVFAVHGLAMLILDGLGLVPIWATYQWISLLIVGTAIYLIAMVVRIGRNDKMDIKMIVWSGICCAFFGVHDVIGGVTGFFLLGRPISVWGMLIFVVTLIMFVEKRFIVINRDLTDLNRTLEGRVKQRTSELEEVNQELGNVNTELKTTLQGIRDTQLQMVQSEKMALLGQLIAGIAHEINTPLGSIKCNLEMERLLIRQLDMGGMEAAASFSQDASGMNRINQNALTRIVDLVKGLKNFARLDEAESKVADLREGLESTLLIVGHLMKGIEIVRDYGSIPSILCFPQQLNQVFLNLIVNAVQAMNGSGTVTIRTRSSGDQVVVAISDTGPGIPPENLAKIFNTGFTTKETGTGLGLMISREIVERHKGRISVESRVGFGTTFTIELPIL